MASHNEVVRECFEGTIPKCGFVIPASHHVEPGSLTDVLGGLREDLRNTSWNEAPAFLFNISRLVGAAALGWSQEQRAKSMALTAGITNEADKVPQLHAGQILAPLVVGVAVFGINKIFGTFTAAAYNGIAENSPEMYKAMSRSPNLRKASELLINKRPASNLDAIGIVDGVNRQSLDPNKGRLNLRQKVRKQASERAKQGILLQVTGLSYPILAMSIVEKDPLVRKKARRDMATNGSLFMSALAVCTTVIIETVGKNDSSVKDIERLTSNKWSWIGLMAGSIVVNQLYKRALKPGIRKVKNKIAKTTAPVQRSLLPIEDI